MAREHPLVAEDASGDRESWCRLRDLEQRLDTLRSEVEGAAQELAEGHTGTALERLRSALGAAGPAAEEGCSECGASGGEHREMCPSW